MKKYIKWIGAVLAGTVYMALAILLGRCLLQGLGALTGWLGSLLGLEQALTRHLSQSLGQLQYAKIRMPWAAGLLLGAAVGGLYCLVRRYRWVRITVIASAAVLFVPLVLAYVCLAQVNDVAVLAMLENILPMLLAFF